MHGPTVLLNKCPKCRKANMFRSPLYKLKLYDMHERCPVCDQNFEPEPGFYWGAMYIGYMFSGFFLLTAAGISLLVVGMNPDDLWITFTIIGIVAVLQFPFTARLARSFWLSVFVKYDKNAPEKNAIQKEAGV